MPDLVCGVSAGPSETGGTNHSFLFKNRFTCLPGPHLSPIFMELTTYNDCQFPGAAVADCHSLGDINRNLFSHSSGGQNFRIKMSAEAPGEMLFLASSAS